MVAGSTRAAILLVTLFLAASCGGDAPSAAPVEITGPPPAGFVARLTDDSRPLPDGRVAWHTSWELCWDRYPGALSYELETVTGEGVSPRLRTQPDACLRVEAAAGEDPPEAVAPRRSMLLALQEGQLAYRVRAVLGGPRRSPWSPPYAVGDTT